jgi:hypothetical protein
MASASLPTILLLSISDHGFLEEMYASLFEQLSQSATLKSAKTASDAIQARNEENLKAVIVTDEGLTARANKKVLDKLKIYVQNGGLAIVGQHFNSFTSGDAFDGFFAAFGIPWKRGDYCRTSF